MLTVLHTESSQGWGGQEIRIVTECDWLNQHGGMTCRLLVSTASQFASRAKHGGLQIDQGPIARKNMRALIFMIRYLSRLKPQVVVTHSSTDSWLVAIARIFVSTKFKIIRTRHVSAPINPSFLTRWMYRQSQYIVTTSEAIKSHIVETLRIHPDLISAIPTGVDVEGTFNPWSPQSRKEARQFLDLPIDHFVVGMVSTLRSWKGHEFALRAILDLPGVNLVIVGDGPQKANIERLIQELGLQDRVYLTGYRSNIEELMAAFDILIQPSFANEGVSQSVMQAMATGLPVIVSNIGGLNEMVITEVDGLIVPPCDSGALHDSIRRLMDDRDLRTRLGRAARRHAERTYSVRTMGLRMKQVIDVCVRT